MLIKLNSQSKLLSGTMCGFQTVTKRESLVEDMGEGVAITWSALPVAHLGPIKKTCRPRPPHALMHDAYSPMHSNEYFFYGNGRK